MWERLLFKIGGSCALVATMSMPGIGQATSITSDSTLGTVVTQSGTTYDITSGTRPGNGQNLFHSFGNFSVGAPDTANFFNDTGLPTSNILSRVTGGNPSNIFGTIQTSGFDGANLFLMNPAGVVFGPSASLNVSGSVHVSTADYLRLTDGTVFNAAPGPTDALLTVAPVAAFGFLDSTPAGISVEGSNLSVPPGETMSLVGGDVTVTGGRLNAFSGRINLASAASPGEILLPALETGPNINGQSFENMGNVDLSGFTILNTTGNGGGSVFIRGGQLVMDSSAVLAFTVGGADGASPAFNVEVTDDAVFRNNSLIASQAFGSGNGGDLQVHAGNIEVIGGAQLVTSSRGAGKAGDILLEAGEHLSISGDRSLLQSIPFSSGEGGHISISSPYVTLGDQGRVSTSTFGIRPAGDISFDVYSLDITGGGAIFTNGSDSASSGTITVNAEDTISLSGQFDGFSTASRIANQNALDGDTGAIFLDAGQVLLADGARILSQTDFSTQSLDTPKIQITAQDLIEVTGNSRIEVVSLLSDVGPLEISAPTVEFSTGAVIRTATTGDGSGGAIEVTGENLILSSGAQVNSSTEQSSGQGGPIMFAASDSIMMSDGATIVSNSSNEGPAGTVNLSAGQTISLTGSGTGVFTEAKASGAGGDIAIEAYQVNLLDEATVSAESTGTAPTAGDAGTIAITADEMFQSNHGMVTTSAAQAQGGDIDIFAGEDLLLTNQALVSARSEGPGDAGNISLESGQNIQLTSSVVSTEAAQASGGNITLKASDLIYLVDSQITSSVQGGPMTSGGNITLDPPIIILENSQILATAIAGQGGNITLVGDLVLIDPSSILDASSQLGVSGSVNIRGPISNLAESLALLPEAVLQAAALLHEPCAAKISSNLSSLVVTQGAMPESPEGWLASGPLFETPALETALQARTAAGGFWRDGLYEGTAVASAGCS